MVIVFEDITEQEAEREAQEERERVEAAEREERERAARVLCERREREAREEAERVEAALAAARLAEAEDALAAARLAEAEDALAAARLAEAEDALAAARLAEAEDALAAARLAEAEAAAEDSGADSEAFADAGEGGAGGAGSWGGSSDGEGSLTDGSGYGSPAAAHWSDSEAGESWDEDEDEDEDAHEARARRYAEMGAEAGAEGGVEDWPYGGEEYSSDEELPGEHGRGRDDDEPGEEAEEEEGEKKERGEAARSAPGAGNGGQGTGATGTDAGDAAAAGGGADAADGATGGDAGDAAAAGAVGEDGASPSVSAPAAASGSSHLPGSSKPGRQARKPVVSAKKLARQSAKRAAASRGAEGAAASAPPPSAAAASALSLHPEAPSAAFAERLVEAERTKAVGNAQFGRGLMQAALETYASALATCPRAPFAARMRAVLYGNRAACLLRLGRDEDARDAADRAVRRDPTYVKALLRRCTASERLGDLEAALADATRAVELEPANAAAKEALARITPLAEAKREQLKDEMLGKLKDLGNTILGKFGMSLDNFKAEKDPETGSYSIRFQ